jgi:hypothetical protein
MNPIKPTTAVLSLLTNEPLPFSEIERQLDFPDKASLRRAVRKLESTGRAVLEPGRGWRLP